MRMINGFEIVAEACVGAPYGHVPGHQYHDVEVGIGRRGKTYRAVVLEVWGSCQGYDEEHGRKKVVSRGDDWKAALRDAMTRARDAGIEPRYLPQAVSEAEDAMYESVHDSGDDPVSVADLLAYARDGVWPDHDRGGE